MPNSMSNLMCALLACQNCRVHSRTFSNSPNKTPLEYVNSIYPSIGLRNAHTQIAHTHTYKLHRSNHESRDVIGCKTTTAVFIGRKIFRTHVFSIYIVDWRTANAISDIVYVGFAASARLRRAAAAAQATTLNANGSFRSNEIRN